MDKPGSYLRSKYRSTHWLLWSVAIILYCHISVTFLSRFSWDGSPYQELSYKVYCFCTHLQLCIVSLELRATVYGGDSCARKGMHMTWAGSPRNYKPHYRFLFLLQWLSGGGGPFSEWDAWILVPLTCPLSSQITGAKCTPKRAALPCLDYSWYGTQVSGSCSRVLLFSTELPPSSDLDLLIL